MPFAVSVGAVLPYERGCVRARGRLFCGLRPFFVAWGLCALYLETFLLVCFVVQTIFGFSFGGWVRELMSRASCLTRASNPDSVYSLRFPTPSKCFIEL